MSPRKFSQYEILEKDFQGILRRGFDTGKMEGSKQLMPFRVNVEKYDHRYALQS